MTRPQPATTLESDGVPVNADFRWDGFRSEDYYQHNYARLRPDDQEILETVRDYFADAFTDPVSLGRLRGVDVGPGANLYPALSMLPFCASIDMREHSAANVAWLRREVVGFRDSWDQFWNVLTARPVYTKVTDPGARIAAAAGGNVVQASIFDLPRQGWDVGTMFFVAESLTGDYEEFTDAVRHFVRALRPGGPFAAAFMAGSQGYTVGDISYPAVAIDGDDVKHCLQGVATKVAVKPIESNKPLRDGTSMLLATGVATGE